MLIKLALNGKEINLTADNTTINSTNFKVDKNGAITASGGTIGGWKIDSGSLTKQTGNYSLEIRADRSAQQEAILVWDNANQRYNFYVRPDGYLYARNATIDGGNLNLSGATYSTPKFNTSGTGLAGFSGENVIYPDGSRVKVDGSTLINLSISKDSSNRAMGSLSLFYKGQTSEWTNLTATSIKSASISPYSLERIKKNIKKFDKNALDIIQNSDIYEYNLKTDKDTDRKMIGFVIGDKYKTPVELISKEGDSINLYSSVGILWKAMQENQKQIKELNNEILKLRGE